MKILIGADPELFVKDGKGSFVSAHGLIPGDKINPHPVKDGAIQVDGMAAEFNINPASTEDEFVSNIKSVLQSLKEALPNHELAIETTATFSKDVIMSVPKEALELGCEPDYNAYTGKENEAPELPEGAEVFRTAAGHIHVGWTEGADVEDPEHIEDCRLLVKEMDYHLGIGSLMWDNDQKRRQLYGKAGAFRVKPYGVEYRVLSNAWLKDEELMRWVYKATQNAFLELANGNSLEKKHGPFARGMVDKKDWGPETVKTIRAYFNEYFNLKLPKVVADVRG